MDYITDLIETIAMSIAYGVVTAIMGWLGVRAKQFMERNMNDKTKREIVKVCVGAVEQAYKSLHGKDKFDKAAESCSKLLSERGISISDDEMTMFIESAVSEFNNAFHSNSKEKE